MTAAPHMMLSADEIATLNAARDVLNALAERALYATPGVTASQADGMVQVRAEVAQQAIFNTLNSVSNWWGVRMTDKQLHNREVVEVEEVES